jgi:ATP-dependent Clp protease, protease subunit
VQGIISIKGQIGKDEENPDGVELIDVITQVKGLPEGTKELEVWIDSPGGYKDTGDLIYNYLESLKKDYKLKTVQKGIVGSIATKLFMVADDRAVNKNEEFFIHNPWAKVEGDALIMQAATNQLNASKTDLLNFYVTRTGTTKEAIEPLMDSETAMTADQAKALGFATEIITGIKVFASVQSKNMSNNKNAFSELLTSIKALIPGAPEVKALNLPLATGDKSLVSDAADEASLAGSNVTLDGQPAPVGEHPLKDGKIIVVEPVGKIKEVKSPAQPAAADMVALQAQLKEQGENINSLAESVKLLVQAKGIEKKAFDEELVKIKAQITNPGVPPKTPKTPETPRKSPIQAAMEKHVIKN